MLSPDIQKLPWQYEPVPTVDGDSWEISPIEHVPGVDNLIATVYDERIAKLIVYQHNLLLPRTSRPVL